MPPAVLGQTGAADPSPVGAKEYRPMVGPLDEVGYAGLMTDGASGASDADGVISTTHRTLPVPSYVEVTSLVTGKTILVRVAGRGPTVNGRLVDLSCGAIRQLGLSTFPAAVRVRHVNPPEQEQVVLSAGRAAAERLPSPPGLLSALRRKLPLVPPSPHAGADACTLPSAASVAATVDKSDDTVSGGVQSSRSAQSSPVSQPAHIARPAHIASPEKAHIPVKQGAHAVVVQSLPPQPAAIPTAKPVEHAPTKGPGYAIQVAALSSLGKANAVAKSLGGYVETAGTIFRVRKGPYATEAAARAALPQIRAKGFADARVITNEGH
jgi:rare lipoprotein A